MPRIFASFPHEEGEAHQWHGMKHGGIQGKRKMQGKLLWYSVPLKSPMLLLRVSQPLAAVLGSFKSSGREMLGGKVQYTMPWH